MDCGTGVYIFTLTVSPSWLPMLHTTIAFPLIVDAIKSTDAMPDELVTALFGIDPRLVPNVTVRLETATRLVVSRTCA